MKLEDVKTYLMANASRMTEAQFSVPLDGKPAEAKCQTDCPHCGQRFDYAAQPETSMGAVACPHCKKSVFNGNHDSDPNNYSPKLPKTFPPYASVNESRSAVRAWLNELPERLWAAEVLNLIANGAQPGHEFYGNQWTSVAYTPNADGKGGTWKTAGGGELPPHLQGVYIRPDLTNVMINPDPKGYKLAVGRDSKNRLQPIYTKEYIKAQSEAKFQRTAQLTEKFKDVQTKIEQDVKSADPAVREPASVAKLLVATGLRPGSDKDTGAEKQAFGATNLQGRHVVFSQGSGVSLKFVGKKGVSLDIPVSDKDTAAMLMQRKGVAGENGRLFHTDDSKLRQYSKQQLGFKPKDFRTLKGTTLAQQEVEKLVAKPKDEKEYKSVVKEIAIKVSKALGNTPQIALQSYISPHVFMGINPMRISGGI